MLQKNNVRDAMYKLRVSKHRQLRSIRIQFASLKVLRSTGIDCGKGVSSGFDKAYRATNWYRRSRRKIRQRKQRARFSVTGIVAIANKGSQPRCSHNATTLYTPAYVQSAHTATHLNCSDTLSNTVRVEANVTRISSFFFFIYIYNINSAKVSRMRFASRSGIASLSCKR